MLQGAGSWPARKEPPDAWVQQHESPMRWMSNKSERLRTTKDSHQKRDRILLYALLQHGNISWDVVCLPGSVPSKQQPPWPGLCLQILHTQLFQEGSLEAAICIPVEAGEACKTACELMLGGRLAGRNKQWSASHLPVLAPKLSWLLPLADCGPAAADPPPSLIRLG